MIIKSIGSIEINLKLLQSFYERLKTLLKTQKQPLHHYHDVTWVHWRPYSRETRLFIQQIVKNKSKDSIKALHNWLFVRESTGDYPQTKKNGQQCGTRFYAWYHHGFVPFWIALLSNDRFKLF